LPANGALYFVVDLYKAGQGHGQGVGVVAEAGSEEAKEEDLFK
jgi:hypothetical protein